jgi:hypothetical protein
MVSFRLALSIRKHQTTKTQLGTVVYACNLNYLGNGDQEDGGSRPDWAKN